MFDTKRALPPEALSFIAKIVDSQEYDLAVNSVAQNPSNELDLGERFLNAIPGLSLKWKLILHYYLYGYPCKKPVEYEEKDLEGKSMLELMLMAMSNDEYINLQSLSVEGLATWNKAVKIRMVRAYVWTWNPWRKRQIAEALERLLQ
jgi:hypothetical protein